MILYIVIGLYIILAGIGAYIWYAAACKDKDVMSFRQSIELCDLPIVTFYIGDSKYNFILDTGSVNSHIDERIVKSRNIKVNYTNENIEIWGAGGKGESNKLGIISIYYNNKEFKELFTINTQIGQSFDMLKETKGIRIHGLLGSKFFNRYKYILDFNKMEFKR